MFEAFLGVQKAFDQVRLPDLLYKLKSSLPQPIYFVLRNNLSNCFFFGWNIIRNYLSMTFSLTFLNASSWTNFVFYLHCRPSNFRNVTVASFLDDTAILAIDDDSMLSTDKLQSGLVLVVNRWLTKWKIKVNLLIAHEFNWMIFIPLLTT